MGFKLVDKSSGIKGLADNQLSINNYGLSFGTDASRFLEGFNACEVYLDRENRRVGFKPTNNALTGFKIAVANKKRTRKALSGSWAKKLPKKRFNIVFEDDMMIINDCDIAEKDE